MFGTCGELAEWIGLAEVWNATAIAPVQAAEPVPV